MLVRLRDWWTADATLGARGEQIAAWYMRLRGYTILQRGARSRLGEIDLIAVHKRTLVFVEVKTRRSHYRGHPAEAITEQKQRQLTRVALEFVKRHDLFQCRTRFDVIAITWPRHQWWPKIDYYQDAFEPL